MPGKRQHYVPGFMLRRFAVDPDAKAKLLYRLDKATGKTELRNTLNEAVIGHYYRIVLEDGTVVDEADKALDNIEDMAARVIRNLADADYRATDEDRYILMLFIASLQNRTPQAREALREVWERGAVINAEMQLSDKAVYHERMGGNDRTN